MLRRLVVYKTAAGVEPYPDYVDALRDQAGAAKIRARVGRAELGNLGDHRAVGEGVVELRIDFGPGYRVYVGLHGDSTVVLLCAGDKSSQDRDIQAARGFWLDYRRNA